MVVAPGVFPPWLKKRIPDSAEIVATRKLLEGLKLNTICQSAHCPNLGECFASRTAAFLILGEKCTRACRFCAVPGGRPGPVDPAEPLRVAEAAAQLGLRHVVITSVTRDDLPDGGAGQFAATVIAIRQMLPGAKVEVLTPDLRGSREALEIVLGADPDVFNHNLETVPRLYQQVRPGAHYQRSLGLLAWARQSTPKLRLKSGLMVGLGETVAEIEEVMAELRTAGCDSLTIGQYLSPSRHHLPVMEYVVPAVYERYEATARLLGFQQVLAGPFVRSSYHAGELLNESIVE